MFINKYLLKSRKEKKKNIKNIQNCFKSSLIKDLEKKLYKNNNFYYNQLQNELIRFLKIQNIEEKLDIIKFFQNPQIFKGYLNIYDNKFNIHNIKNSAILNICERYLQILKYNKMITKFISNLSESTILELFTCRDYEYIIINYLYYNNIDLNVFLSIIYSSNLTEEIIKILFFNIMRSKLYQKITINTFDRLLDLTKKEFIPDKLILDLININLHNKNIMMYLFKYLTNDINILNILNLFTQKEKIQFLENFTLNIKIKKIIIQTTIINNIELDNLILRFVNNEEFLNELFYYKTIKFNKKISNKYYPFLYLDNYYKLTKYGIYVILDSKWLFYKNIITINLDNKDLINNLIEI